MKELFKAFMERAIHDDEMEKAQELAKDFPVEIALPQAMGFQAGYNAALAELKKPSEDVYSGDVKTLLDDIRTWNDGWAVPDHHAALLIQQYAESYHAKKCAECGESQNCTNCGNEGYACLECSHITPDNWQPLPEPPHA